MSKEKTLVWHVHVQVLMHCHDQPAHQRWDLLHARLRPSSPTITASLAGPRLERANDEPTTAAGASGSPHPALSFLDEQMHRHHSVAGRDGRAG